MVKKEHFIIVGLIVFIIIFAASTCRREVKIPVNPAIAIRDSARIVDSAKSASITRQKNYILTLEKERAELIIAKDEAENQLSEAQKRSARLATGVKVAKINNDTTGYVIACDSLAEENAILNSVVNTNQYFHEKLVENYDSTLSAKDNIIQTQEVAYSVMRSLLNQANTALDDFHLKLTKSSKKSNKPYNVSIGAGVGLGPDLKPIPVVALTINKTLFRF